MDKTISKKVIAHRFDARWCVDFFLLSGDTNHSLHLPPPSGRGIVQGVAVLTTIGTIVSAEYPRYMLANIENVAFSIPVMIGDEVQFIFAPFNEGRRVMRLQIQIIKHEQEISRLAITLIRTS